MILKQENITKVFFVVIVVIQMEIHITLFSRKFVTETAFKSSLLCVIFAVLSHIIEFGGNDDAKIKMH